MSSIDKTSLLKIGGSISSRGSLPGFVNPAKIISKVSNPIPNSSDNDSLSRVDSACPTFSVPISSFVA